MDFDEVSQTHKSMLNAWHDRLSKYSTSGIEKLASKYRNGDKCDCVEMHNGSFNWCFKMVFTDGTAWIRREVAVMRFLKERTRVPVPQVIAFGMAADNHAHLSLPNGLKGYRLAPSWRSFLDPSGDQFYARTSATRLYTPSTAK
jgi:hypothetical protein